MAIPVRQCVACKKRFPKQTLLKIVRLSQGKIVYDGLQKKSGRSVYLCRHASCIEKAKSGHLLSRFWDSPLPSSFYLELLKTVKFEETEIQSIQKILGFAKRANQLFLGVTAIESGLKTNKVKLVIFDNRTGKTTRERIEKKCLRYNIPYRILDATMILDRIVGKANCKCAGVIDSHFAKQL